ncbi:hypothetical protein ACFTWH_26855 [Streptomyces sp. NPDC057011]|uniref:hypothetical protein n=1 Tax=unclassified Streptomyces TaxID=2593676 RepID=UPI003624EADE
MPADPSEIEPWAWAAGGMISNAPDLERFMTALLRGRPAGCCGPPSSGSCSPCRRSLRRA